jgi:hypothetical protein
MAGSMNDHCPAESTGAPEARTIQLRRYALAPGTEQAFVEWWRETMVPAREDFGFTVEFGYLDSAAGELVWAVSKPASRADFESFDRSWEASAERELALSVVPARARRTEAVIVEDARASQAAREVNS